MKKLFAIRGAVCTKNTVEDITKDVCDMCNAIFTENNLKEEDLVSLHFTVTKEITKINPATALRKGETVLKITEPALFCSMEPEMEHSLPSMIRVMVTTYADDTLKKTNVYLNGAEVLRPDYNKAK